MPKNGKSGSHCWGRGGSTQFAQQLETTVTAPPLVGCVVWSQGLTSGRASGRKTLLQYSSLTPLKRECYEGEVQPYRKTDCKPMMIMDGRKGRQKEVHSLGPLSHGFPFLWFVYLKCLSPVWFVNLKCLSPVWLSTSSASHLYGLSTSSAYHLYGLSTSSASHLYSLSTSSAIQVIGT